MSMNLKTRRGHLARLLAIGLAAPLLAQAQSAWPAKPVRIVVPFAAGGTTDLLARALAPELQKAFGQPFLVDNKPGSGGNTGAAEVAKAAPDGYTLLMGTVGTHAINAALYPKMPFDHVKDFAPISLVAGVPNVLVVNPALPVHSVAELVALARKEPGKLNFASPGAGSSLHLSAELFKALEKIDIVHVPYKGGGPAMTDVLAGKPEMMFQVLGVALPYIESGKLRALAVTSAERAAVLPNVPTMMEAGVKNYAAVTWNGLLAPAGTPRPIIDKLHAAIVKALADPSVQEGYRKIGQFPAVDTPAEFQALIRDEASKWSRVIKDANIQAQ